MLHALRRLLRGGAPVPAWPDAQDWAETRGAVLRRTRDGRGFVVEGRYEDRPWRLEWGPAQRDYLVGHELRLRMDLALPPELQMLVVGKDLMRALESEAYARCTDHLQTQIDHSSPEEVRWIVMFPKMSLRAYPALHGRFGAVSSSLPALGAWLRGPLSDALARQAPKLLGPRQRFVLMTMRNRVQLRLQAPEPAADVLQSALDLFLAAVVCTPDAVSALQEPLGAWPVTTASSWHQPVPEEGKDRGG